MKIAILTPGGVDRGGVHRVIHAQLWLIERLARTHEVHVFTHGQEGEPGDWMLHGAHVHNVGTRSGWRRRLLDRFADVHRASSFRVIHAFFTWGGLYGALLSWRYRVPLLFHLSGDELVALDDIGYGQRRSVVGTIKLRVALARARRVTVATRYMQELAASIGVIAECVPLGVALDRWPTGAPHLTTATPVRLLHVGDIRPVKDQAMLLDAVNRLRERGLDFHLDVVGADTMDGQVQRSAHAQACARFIRWHGVVSRDVLRELMDESDFLLVTSRHEAGPLVALEAAVAGVPVIGTRVGHIADWASHGATAVPVGDADALATAVMSLLADPSTRVALAREALARAVAIDADYTAAAFDRIHAELAAA